MTDETCSADGCDEYPQTKGMCTKHYARFWRLGSTELPTREKRLCEIDNCGGTHLAKGLCSPHYHRRYRRRKGK